MELHRTKRCEHLTESAIHKSKLWGCITECPAVFRDPVLYAGSPEISQGPHLGDTITSVHIFTISFFLFILMEVVVQYDLLYKLQLFGTI